MSEKSHGFISLVIRKVMPAIILLVVGFGSFLWLFLSRTPAEKAERQVTFQDVTVTASEPYEGPIFIEANGVVVPHREIIMAAQVAGSIQTKEEQCQSGHWVPKGTPLLRIDKRDYDLAVKRLEAEVKQADSQLTELAAEIQNAGELVKLAERDLELQRREKSRLDRLRNSATASELDQASLIVIKSENALLTQQHQLNLLTTRQIRLDASKELAELQLEKATIDRTRTEVNAPSDGVIVMEEVEEGTYVQPGTRLIVFEDTTLAEVEFNLSVNELYWIMQDKRVLGLPTDEQDGSFFRLPPIDNVTVEFEVEGTTMEWTGRLDGFAGYGVDEQTRNVPCRVIVDEPSTKLNQGLKTLRRGMFVRIKIPVEPSVKMIRFPEQALNAQNQVWVVRENKLKGLDVRVAGRLSTDELKDYGRLSDDQLQAINPAMDTSPNKRGPNAQIDQTVAWVIALDQEKGIQVGDKVVDSPLSLPYDEMDVVVVDPTDDSPTEAVSAPSPTEPVSS